MTVYYIVFITLCITSVLEMYGWEKGVRKKVIEIGIYLSILLIVVLRGISVGGDLGNYKDSFYLWSGYDFNELFQVRNCDIGWVLLCWLLGNIIQGFQFFVVVIGILSFTLIFYVIKNLSDNISLGMLVFLAANGLSDLCNVMRQELAVALSFYAVFLLIKKNKLFGMFFLSAMLVHRTAIVTLLYPFIVFERNERKHILQVVLLLISFIATVAFGMNWVVPSYSINDYSGTMISGRGMKLLLVESYAIVALGLLKKQKYNVDNVKTIARNSCIVGLLFQILAIGFGLLYRLTLYYIIFYSILIPNIITEQKQNRNMKMCIAIVGLLLFCTYYLLIDAGGIVPYIPFWKDGKF